MIVRLYEHIGTALVIPHPTGVLYANQAGGHACFQPQAEGFVVPIANDVGLAPNHEFRSPENELYRHFEKVNSCGAPLTEDDATKIEAIMRRLPLWRGLSVDRTRISESVEAWVYVHIAATDKKPVPVDGLSYPLDAILTWTNTD